MLHRRSSAKVRPAISCPYDPSLRTMRWPPGHRRRAERVGEITQLRQEDVIQQEGVWAIRLTPEAGTIKTGDVRVVPIHDI